MKVIHGLKDLRPINASVVAIGVFDGVHVGHRAIISKAVASARRLGLPSVVVTFDPHPLKALHPAACIPSLMSLAHRIRLMDELGVDVVIIIRFTSSVANLAPAAFVEDILIKKLGARRICIGENFYFGRGAHASAGAMRELAGSFGAKATIIRSVKVDRKVASSSLIRALITTGELAPARRFLGRSVSILGTVVHGAKRGRILGFPTANIDPHHEAIPPSGVYAVRVLLNGSLRCGVVNIGVRPTFYRGYAPEPSIEVHIFNFNKDIYGKDIELIFIKKLREERAFKDKNLLMRQIRQDAGRAARILRPH